MISDYFELLSVLNPTLTDTEKQKIAEDMAEKMEAIINDDGLEVKSE